MMLSGRPHAMVLAVFMWMLGTYTWAQAMPDNQQVIIAKAIMVKNLVTKTTDDQAPQAIKRGQTLALGNTITTGNKGRAILRFNDGTLATLGSNSSITIKQFVVNRDEKRGLLEFTKGALRVVTGAITRTQAPDFSVRTPMGSIGIRGTDFWCGNLSHDGSVDVLLINSEHALEVSNELGRVLLQEDGQGTTLKPNLAPLPVRTWPKAKVDRALNAVN